MLKLPETKTDGAAVGFREEEEGRERKNEEMGGPRLVMTAKHIRWTRFVGYVFQPVRFVFEQL